MTVNTAGVCALANCRTVNTADPTKCDVCQDGFYRAWDSTRCYARNIQDVTKSCPSTYVTYSNPNVCGPICPSGQYANATTKLCQSCSTAATGGITNCATCGYENGALVCLTCTGSMRP